MDPPADRGETGRSSLIRWASFAAHRELWKALWDRGRGIEVVVVVWTTDERGRAETVLANWARDRPDRPGHHQG